MSTMLIIAIISMTLALLFYSVGVWGEKLGGGLKPWNLSMFWIGLFFDTSGTTLMTFISSSIKFDVHAITGALAIILMIFHAIWATIVLAKKNDKLMHSFHKFSIVVWLIWLIPYFTGVILNV